MDKDAYIKKLERRIHMQRRRLRWWEEFSFDHLEAIYWRRTSRLAAHFKMKARQYAMERARKLENKTEPSG